MTDAQALGQAPRESRRWIGIFYALLAGLYLTVFLHWQPLAAGDPDRYYHLAIARLAADTPIVRSVPQADDLGWAQEYPNRYVLFHFLNGLLYRIGGERAALATTPLAILILLFFLLRFGARNLKPYLAFLLLLCTLISPDWLVRIVLLRPHVYSLLFLLLLTVGLLERNGPLVLISAVLYPLFYHASYLPGAVLGLAGLVAWKVDPKWRRPFLLGITGLFLGLVLNPVFPSNISGMWEVFRIGAGQSQIPYGLRSAENQTEPLEWMVGRHVFFFSLLFFLAFLLLPRRWQSLRRKLEADRESLAQMLFLFPVLLLFWAMTAYILPGVVYAVPVTYLALVLLLRRLPTERRQRWLLAGTAFVFHLPVVLAQLRHPIVHPDLRQIFDTIGAIPTGAANGKVFNCEWSDSAYLFYARPDLRFVDVNDPTYLPTHAPALAALRMSLVTGEAPFPYGALRYAFKADYVFCRTPVLINRLEHDPHFRRLYPKGTFEALPSNARFLYELAKQPIPSFTHGLDSAAPFWTSTTESGSSRKPPETGMEWTPIRIASSLPPRQRSPVVDFFRWLGQEREHRPRDLASSESDSSFLCLPVRPSAEELRQRRGATLMGLGGGTRLRVWWNGQPLFSSDPAVGDGKLLDRLVALPSPLSPRDEIEIVSCVPRSAPFFGLALSFWSDSELEAECRWKSESPFPSSPVSSFLLDRPSSCLGPVIRGAYRNPLDSNTNG